MKNLNLTDAEFAIVKQAVETHNDMNNDMVFEQISTNLFPRGEAVTTINAKQATVLRKELNEAMRVRETTVSLMTKIGSRMNAAGYSS